MNNNVTKRLKIFIKYCSRISIEFEIYIEYYIETFLTIIKKICISVFIKFKQYKR